MLGMMILLKPFQISVSFLSPLEIENQMRRFAQFRYHLYNLKNVKNTHAGVILLIKLLNPATTKSVTPPWMFFTFFKFYKWRQIA